MELLIPGLILVALMAYASTRIKRIAAEAFEPETIDTPEFTFEKPDGFLNVLSLPAGLTLESYSKEYGVGHAKNFRQARAEIRTFSDRKAADIVRSIEDSISKASKINEVIDGKKYTVIEGETVENGVGLQHTFKVAEGSGAVFELKMTTLEDVSDEILSAVRSMVANFVVK